MKILLVVLSAAVLGGLGTYAAFAAFGVFGMLMDRVTMNVDALVAFVAATSVVCATITIGLHAALVRSDRRQFESLERRIAELEARKS